LQRYVTSICTELGTAQVKCLLAGLPHQAHSGRPRIEVDWNEKNTVAGKSATNCSASAGLFGDRRQMSRHGRDNYPQRVWRGSLKECGRGPRSAEESQSRVHDHHFAGQREGGQWQKLRAMVNAQSQNDRAPAGRCVRSFELVHNMAQGRSQAAHGNPGDEFTSSARSFATTTCLRRRTEYCASAPTAYPRTTAIDAVLRDLFQKKRCRDRVAQFLTGLASRREGGAECRGNPRVWAQVGNSSSKQGESVAPAA